MTDHENNHSHLNKQIGDLGSGRVADLLEAFNAAAAMIQRSSHSEDQVYAVFKEQIASLNLIGVISILDDDRQNLVIRALSQPSSLLDRLKKLVGFEAEGYALPANQVQPYHEVLQSGKPLYLPDSSTIVVQFIPEDLNTLKDKFIEAYGNHPAIVAPIQSLQEIIGVFNVFGSGLTAEHGPVIEALANHISIAIENARLFTQLHQAEVQYRSLFESAIDGIVIIDPISAKILSCNRKFVTITGLKEDDLIGKPVYALEPGQVNEAIQRMLEIVRLRGQIEIKLEITRPDQERRFVRVLAKLFTANEKPLIQGMFEDITDQVRSEQALQLSEERFRSIFKNAMIGIYRATPEGQIVIANPALIEMLGHSSLEELQQRNLEELGYASDPSRQQFRTIISDEGQVNGLETIWRRKDGLELYVRETAQTIKAADGQVLYYEGTVEDITQQKKLENSLRQRAEELEAVRQASLSLTASLELSQVLDNILYSAISLLPEVNNSHIFLYNADGDGKLTFGAALWADGPQKKPFSEPRQDGLTYSVARTGNTILVPDMTQHPLYKNAPTSWAGAIIGLPLIFGERVVGVMNISYRSSRQFPENEIHMLRLLADQASIAIENARLFAQAATERRHLSLLYDIGREIVSSLEPDVILLRAIHLTCQALNGVVGQAFIYLPEDARLSIRAIFGSTNMSLQELDENFRLRPGIGLAGWVAENRQPLYIPDLRQDVRWLPVPGLDDDLNSAISAPILSGQQLLGVLTVLHIEPEHFSPDHLVLMSAICQEVSLALSNASRYQEVQRRLAEITFIQSLTQTFNQRHEPQVLLEEFVRRLGVQVGYPQVRIFLIEHAQLVLKASYGPRPEKSVFPLDKGIIGRVARTARPALVPDVTKDPDYQDCMIESASELAVPIFRGSQVVGVINIETDRSRQLNEQDHDLLQVLAGQISVALENALLYEQVRLHAEELEQTVAQRTAELTELYELSQEIAFRFSYQELLTLVMEHLQSAVLSDAVIGYLSNGDCRSISVRTSWPLSDTGLEKIRATFLEAIHAHGGKKALNCALELVQSKDYQANQVPVSEFTSYIYAPVKIGGQLVGLLMLASQNRAAFRAEHMRLVNTFANQASTAAQRLTALLTAQQKHLESLVEHMPVGTVLLDHEFNLLVTNPIGLQILTILNPEIDDKIGDYLGSTPFQELLEHQEDLLPVEITLEGPPRRIFEAQIRPVGEPSQQWVLTLREVTRERENQDRIQSQERLATVGQLAAGIAHDFNNIMAAILVYADLLRNEPDIPKDSRDKLKIIEEQVQRAASLIRQILDFSRRSIMEQTALDLLPFVKELDKMLGRILPETISLELTYQPGNYWVNADPTRLQQVFMNLALNARDAMPEGGLLQFALTRYELQVGQPPPVISMPSGNWIRIQISDTGTGIPAEVIQHIFEPFFTTKPVGQGTGLGLAQVYGIIRNHEGFIDVKSQPGAGTNFIIYLPMLQNPPLMPPISDIPQEVSGQGETILVVEDDEITREAICALLQANQYEVITAANGQHALEIFEREMGRITLIISDVVMPAMGGIELYNHLQANYGDIKILFITGHPLEGNYQRILEKGGVHWLQKPFSVQKFNETIWSLLKDETFPG